MRQIPPLSAVRVFEAAARHENFSAAAAELGLSQAGVSYQVKSLEDRLGTALFVRDRGRVRLTPAGQRLMPVLGAAFDAMERAFAAFRSEDEGLLTISTTVTFANAWLAWRLGRFQVEFPDLAVRLDTSGELADLVGGEADVAIRAGLGQWPGVEAIKLFDLDFTPMCSPAFLRETERKLGRELEPADLVQLPLMNPADEWWDRWFAAAGVESSGRAIGSGLRLDSQVNEGHAAMGGVVFALLSPMFWVEDLAAERLVQPFEITARGRFAYWLAFAEGRRQVAKIKRFREWLQAAMAD